MKFRHDMITVFVVRPDARGESHEFLQLKRSEGDYMGGTWQLIRGGVDENETYIDAALRELREESGLRPLELYRLGSIESFYTSFDDTQWHSVPFCAMVQRDQDVALNHEHVDSRWVSRDKIETELMWASERAVWRDLIHDILENSAAKPLLRIFPQS